MESGARDAHACRHDQCERADHGEVATWPGIEAVRDGSHVTYRYGRREIGHLHGDRAAHFGFPKQIWTELNERAGSTTTPCSPTSPARPRARSQTMKTSAK